MKLIIDIDEKDYEGACKATISFDGAMPIYQAIKAGTPLPKGHGRLIEEPTETDISNTVGGNNDFAECIRDSVKAVFDNAPTIVEADKEEKS